MSPNVRRRLLLALALGVGLLAALVLALPSIVSLDAMRSRILGAAEASLHRKVEAGSIRLEIFSGLGAGIDQFMVRNRPGCVSPALASIEHLSVKLAFWPLLSRRIEVRKIVLDGATVTIERDQAGTLSVSDLVAASSEPPEPSPSSFAAFVVSRLQIARGRFLFVDRRVSPGKTASISVDELTGEISDVGATSAARFDLTGRFLADGSANLSLKGTVGPPAPGKGFGESQFSATFAAKRLALSRLRPYLGVSSNLDPGVLSIDGTAEGSILGALRLAGNVALAPQPPSSAIPPIEGKFAMTFDWPVGSLVIAKSPLAVARLPLTAEGRIDGLHATTRVDLRIATPGDVPLDRVTGLPGLAGSLPSSVKLSGRVRLDASVEGPFADLTTHASADAAPVAVTLGAQSIFAAPTVRATLASRGKEPLAGRITAASGRLQKLPFENLAADWTWDKGSLTVTPTLRTFGGTLRGRLESDFSHPKSESHVSLDLDGVHVQPLVESLTSARNVLSGILTAKMSLASRGLGWDALSKTGRGEGRLSIADADLKTVELMPKVASTLSAIGRVAGFRVPASLESSRFTSLETGLHLADGRLSTPGLSLSGRDIAATADGSIGLDRSLAYQGRVVLGPAIVKGLGNAGRYIADSQGRVSLPFRASGQISSPKVVVDESIVLDLGRRALTRQLVGDGLDVGDGKKTEPLDLLQQFLRQPPPPTPTPH